MAMSPQKPQTSKERAARANDTRVVLLLGAGLLFLFHLNLRLYFPNRLGSVGHDYAWFLPQLLAGYYWAHENGYWQLPWGTPAFCGGLPLFPNPQTPYHSLAQLLTLIMDPLNAVYAATQVFAAVGYLAFYSLARTRFSSSRDASLLGAALFMFNGFYCSRMIVGHVGFHAFMLVPWLAFLVIPAGNEAPTPSTRRTLACSAGAALLVAYCIFSGAVNSLVPIVIAVAALGALHAIGRGTLRTFSLRLALACSWGACIAAIKVNAATAYLARFHRSDYLLPGFPDLTWQVLAVARLLFLGPFDSAQSARMTNVQWDLDRHEFEYCVTVVPLLLLLMFATVRLMRQPDLLAWLRGRRADGKSYALALLFTLLMVPLVANHYAPTWNGILKALPFARSMSTMLRMYAAYMPIAILGGALAFDQLFADDRRRSFAAALGIGLGLSQFMATDRTYYQEQDFDPRGVVAAYQHTRQSGGQVQPISRVGDRAYDNDALWQGVSPIRCYEPIFGYRLESFPSSDLAPGPSLGAAGKKPNIRNPACYVFPDENQCVPGDSFRSDQLAEAAAFVSYHPQAWQFPTSQSLATFSSLVATLLAAVALLLAAGRGLRGRLQRTRQAPSSSASPRSKR